jgi:hypothetical protein
MKFPVFSQLAGNWPSETSSLVTASSSGESANFRFLRRATALWREGSIAIWPGWSRHHGYRHRWRQDRRGGTVFAGDRGAAHEAT